MSLKDGGGGPPPRDLPSAGKGIKVNHDVLKDVYNKLADDHKELDSHVKGGPKYLQHSDHLVVLTGTQLGHYPAAEGQTGMDGFAGSCKNAYDQIGSVYSQFVTAYENLIATLKKSADNHAEAEQRNVDTMNRAYNDSSSSSSSSQFYA